MKQRIQVNICGGKKNKIKKRFSENNKNPKNTGSERVLSKDRFKGKFLDDVSL